jgi:hypothetical protein
MANQGMPWLQNADGGDKAKSGRKTNAERQQTAILELGTGTVDMGGHDE